MWAIFGPSTVGQRSLSCGKGAPVYKVPDIFTFAKVVLPRICVFLSKFTLADIEVSATTRNATIAVQSMDSKPINQSKNLTITLAARSLPKTEYELPFRSEPVEGQLQIKAPKGLKLFKHLLDQRKEIPVAFKNGQYSVVLDKNLGTYWLSLSE